MPSKATFLLGLSLFLTLSISASNPSSSDRTATTPSTAVSFPRFIRFRGTVPAGSPETVGATFALYQDQTGGSPIWLEVQNVHPDATGHYSVLLGSTLPDGLPTDAFDGNRARWLGVTVDGGEEQSRVQLVSVPYALKAGDAETLGGRPLSSFVLNESVTATTAPSQGVIPIHPTTQTAMDISSSTGTTNQIAKWTNSTTLGNSIIFDNGTNVGIGTTMPKATLDVHGESIFRSYSTLFITTATNGPVFTFTNASKPTAASWGFGVPGYLNATAFFIYDNANQVSPFTIEQGAGANSLYFKKGGNVGIGTSTPTNKLTVAGNVQVTGKGSGIVFPDATVQTTALPAGCTTSQVPQWSGTAWTCQTGGTVASIVAGTGLTGGTITGTGTIGVDPTKVPLLASSNTFTADQNITGNLSLGGFLQANLVNSTTGYQLAGSTVLSSANGSLFVGGFAGAANSSGTNNTFTGYEAGQVNDMASYNSFYGYQAGIQNAGQGSAFNTFLGAQSGYGNTSGASNTLIGAEAGSETTTGSGDTFVGEGAGYYNEGGSNNTYIGSNTGANNIGDNNIYLGQSVGPPGIPPTGESDTIRIGGSHITSTYLAGVYNVVVSDGISVVVDANGRLGASAPSSQRFKENIRDMGDATDGLFKLRPVSYYYRREFDSSPTRTLQYGLIAEELAQVYPELVTYDEQGRPNAIKYQYLTPMLLNEVQKQHAVIGKQQAVIQAQEERAQAQEQQIQDLQKRLARMESQLAHMQMGN